MQSPFSLVDQENGFDKPERKDEGGTDHTVRIESGRAASTSLRDGDAAEGSPSFRLRRIQKSDGESQLTFRAVGAGLLVGSLLCCSNTYFGLQTGWVTMGSLQSAVLGFGVFRVLERYGITSGLSIGENVILQTTSVATATMPLAAGLVGIVPALGMMNKQQNPAGGPIVFPWWQLMLWSLALAFLGVFIAVPLRTQTVIKEKLRFPSGTATAKVIRMLHGGEALDEADEPHRPCTLPVVGEEGSLEGSSSGSGHKEDSKQLPGKTQVNGRTDGYEGHNGFSAPMQTRSETTRLEQESQRRSRRDSIHFAVDGDEHHPLLRPSPFHPALSLSGAASLARVDSSFGMRALEKLNPPDPEDTGEWARAWSVLLWSFAAAGVYSLVSSRVAWLKSFPVFTWVGLPVVTAWGWDVTPSMGYIGQGMIMGPKTALSMLFGAILGFGILGPHARSQGWAPGPISDWKNGATGWILWISLAIMLGDSLTSLSLLIISSAKCSKEKEDVQETRGFASGRTCRAISTYWWVGGLVLSAAFCTAVMTPLLHMRVYEPLAAVVLALLVAVLAVRALGQTDLNPVSGVGKLSQVVFAVIAPRQVVPNLVAGAIAEAGANQAGDMMQDFKTAHLLGVCPRAQFLAMLMGSAASALVSVGAYSLYTSAWPVPGPEFPAPTAEIWLDMADLVNGGALPSHVVPYCAVAAVLAAVLPIAAFFISRASAQYQDCPAAARAKRHQWRRKALAILEVLLPSGIGIAVGMYVNPRFTVPRVIGSVAEQLWLRGDGKSHKRLMVIVASGLVLGEGTASIFSAFVKAIFG